MSEKPKKTEYSIQQEPSTYQTGSTKPPKNYTGLIIVLLGLVIFLGGIVAALGITNIRLFQALSAQTENESNAVGFSYNSEHNHSGGGQSTGLGFSGEAVSEFWHISHQLPRGIFIQQVDENSAAALLGVLPGDILIRANNIPIISMEELQAVLEEADTSYVCVVLYRDQKEIVLQLPIED